MSDLDEVLVGKQDKVTNVAHNFATVFGEEVRQRRQYLNLTQEELTLALRKCGIKVTQTYISRLEVGQRRNPSAQLVVALAFILSMSLDNIIFSLQNTDNGK